VHSRTAMLGVAGILFPAVRRLLMCRRGRGGVLSMSMLAALLHVHFLICCPGQAPQPAKTITCLSVAPKA